MESKKLIKKTRELLGLSQTDFGKLIDKPNYTVSDYEKGRSIVPGDIVLKIKNIYDNITKHGN